MHMSTLNPSCAQCSSFHGKKTPFVVDRLSRGSYFPASSSSLIVLVSKRRRELCRLQKCGKTLARRTRLGACGMAAHAAVDAMAEMAHEEAQVRGQSVEEEERSDAGPRAGDEAVDEERNAPEAEREASHPTTEGREDVDEMEHVDVDSEEFWADQKQLWEDWEKEKNELEKKIEEQMKQLESLGDASKDVGEMIAKQPTEDSSVSTEFEDERMPVLDEDVDDDTPEGWETDIQKIPARQAKATNVLSDLLRLLLRCLEFVFVVFLLRWAFALLDEYYFNPLSLRPS